MNHIHVHFDMIAHRDCAVCGSDPGESVCSLECAEIWMDEKNKPGEGGSE